jgi:hypothetical protein
MDTRPAVPTIDAQFAGIGAIGPAATTNLTVINRGGVPATGVGAVALNVTATNPTGNSYLTVWPTGAAQPLASNLNYGISQTVPNMVIVPVGANGQISIYNHAGSTHVIVDVVGWFSRETASAFQGIGWVPGFLGLSLVYFYTHYFFASLTAHISAMYAPFLAVAIGLGAPPLLAALIGGWVECARGADEVVHVDSIAVAHSGHAGEAFERPPASELGEVHLEVKMQRLVESGALLEAAGRHPVEGPDPFSAQVDAAVFQDWPCAEPITGTALAVPPLFEGVRFRAERPAEGCEE